MGGLYGGRIVSTKKPSLLEPLLEIKSMKTVILHIPIVFDLTDAGYKHVALAWPEIEKSDWNNLGLMSNVCRSRDLRNTWPKST